jgi:hypothetical protein
VDADRYIDKYLSRVSFHWYLSSTVPPIKPYHLSHLDPVVGDMLPELKTPIFLEPKYDGTHILVSSTGVFKHDGKPVQPDQLAGLLYVAEAEEEFVEALLSGLDRYNNDQQQ